MLNRGTHPNTASNGTSALAPDYRKRFYEAWYKRDHEVGLRVGQKTAKELGSGIEIVHECFTERGDSILSVFSGELNE